MNERNNKMNGKKKTLRTYGANTRKQNQPEIGTIERDIASILSGFRVFLLHPLMSGESDKVTYISRFLLSPVLPTPNFISIENDLFWNCLPECRNVVRTN